MESELERAMRARLEREDREARNRFIEAQK